MHNWNNLQNDESGAAVVEAAILFPIIFMIFFGLVILALYMPTRAALQYATQYTADALAVEYSDTWLIYDEDSMQYQWVDGQDYAELGNVYVTFFRSFTGGNPAKRAEKMVRTLDHAAPKVTFISEHLEVDCCVRNYLVYKEVIVTATQKIRSPLNLSFVGFPTEIPITVSSTAVVKNGDEFVRDIDLAADLISWLREKYKGVDEIFKSLNKIIGKYDNFLE